MAEENVELEVVPSILDELETMHNKEDITDWAYTISKRVVEEYLDNQDIDLNDHIHAAMNDEIIYYDDCWRYLQDRDIVDFNDAIDQGFNATLFDITWYFLEDEVYHILNELNIEY